MLSLLSHQVTLKGQNRVNYVTVIKVHCTVGGNSLMKGKGMFLGYSVRRHPLPLRRIPNPCVVFFDWSKICFVQ